MWHFGTVSIILHWVPVQGIILGGSFRNSSVSWLLETHTSSWCWTSGQFNYFKEMKIFSSADGQTGMGREKEGTLGFFPVLLYHSVVCPGEKSKLCVPQGWWSLNGPSILCNRLLWNLQICDLFQTSFLSSTILPCSQAVTCSATSGEAFKCGFLALAKWVWDFHRYFVKCLNDFWAIVVLVVSVSMMFQCLKTCRGKCSLHSL